MISEIKGDVIAKNKESVTIMVGGMGFEVNVAPGLLDSLGFNEEVHLHTRLLLRDDGLHLYGFKNLEERALFDMLLKVQGIGPKTALGVLATLPVQDFYRAVLSRDEHTLTRIPGIGKKTAGRIVVELRDKIGLSDEIAVQFREPDTLIGEGIEALMALGYTRQEAETAILRATESAVEPDLETLLREALKYLARF